MATWNISHRSHEGRVPLGDPLRCFDDVQGAIGGPAIPARKRNLWPQWICRLSADPTCGILTIFRAPTGECSFRLIPSLLLDDVPLPPIVDFV